MKEFEAENAKLKRMYASLALENEAIEDLPEKSPGSDRGKGIGQASNPRKEHEWHPGMKDRRHEPFEANSRSSGESRRHVTDGFHA